ncbi:Esterase-like activity of phytase family protein [Tenacibaculum sp. 190130A14a]
MMVVVFLGCQKKKMTLTFLDELVVKDSLQFGTTVIGGLSGIDRYKDQYYMVVDDARNPRILQADILIDEDQIQAVNFNNIIKLKDTTSSFYNSNALDLESVFIDAGGKLNLVSEGSIRKGKDPLVFTIDINSRAVTEFIVPDYFKASSKEKPKHNGVFEGSSRGFSTDGFWVAMEAPLRADGEEPTFHKTQSPVRITYFNNKTKLAEKQYAYELEKIDKPAKGKINLNGVTAILEYQEGKFLVVERIYQSGYGSHGNVVRIFNAFADKETTNTLALRSLKKEAYIPLKKELLLDFDSIQKELTEGIIDNIEGITFGPTLSNGNQSVILISDDNFQVYGKQLNQFILLEIHNK